MYFISKGEVSVLVSNGKCARVTVGVKDLMGKCTATSQWIYIYIHIIHIVLMLCVTSNRILDNNK